MKAPPDEFPSTVDGERGMTVLRSDCQIHLCCREGVKQGVLVAFQARFFGAWLRNGCELVPLHVHVRPNSGVLQSGLPSQKAYQPAMPASKTQQTSPLIQPQTPDFTHRIL